MKIKQLRTREMDKAISLVWDVFLEYEAEKYSKEGKKAFGDAIHSEEYLRTIKAYGAFEGKELLGVIATREEGSHVALFFVHGKHHGEGIGRSLWNAVLEDNTSETITVHSSLFAVPVYRKLGFEQTGDVKEEGGIQYVPMRYRMTVAEDCPCSKVNCQRHGHCNECKAHHAGSNRLRPCEREKN